MNLPLEPEPGPGSPGVERPTEAAITPGETSAPGETGAPGETLASGAPRPMAVVDGVDGLDRSLGRLFIVIGVFDGLHLGHEYLLGELCREAARRDARPAVITFDHHPDEILTGKAPPLLCDPAERLERLEAAGVAATVVQTFDVALRETRFDAFVGRIAERVELAGFLMTPESAFGYQRAGTPEAVTDLGHQLGFDVVVVPPFTLDDRPVSSSAVRAAIQAGELDVAQRLLGRPYAAVGDASAGSHGIQIGFPMPVSLPPAGTYRAHVDGAGAALPPGEAAVESEREVTVRGRWIEIAGADAMHLGPRLRVTFAGR